MSAQIQRKTAQSAVGRPVHAPALGLAFALLLGLLHGLVYVFLVPPWQHYDEPNHFEYAWLEAYRPDLPRPGRDPYMHRLVLASMLEHDFFEGMGFEPDLSLPDDLISIGGFSQLDEPRLYYWLVSLPLRLLPPDKISAQLYTGRLVSLLMFLLSILAIWGVARQVTQRGSHLRWMAPVTMALLPSFVNSMTAVNNDAIAVASFSFFIWGSVKLIQKGFTLPLFFGTVSAGVLCFYTKSTAFVALPLLPIAVLLSLLHPKFVVLRSYRWLAWGLLFCGALSGLASLLSWGDAAVWYRSTAQAGPVRIASREAVLGEHVLRLETQAAVTPSWFVPLFQPLPVESGSELSDQRVTLGAWIWASHPIEVQTPGLHAGSQSYYDTVLLSTQPAFYALQVDLPKDTTRVWVSLDPGAAPRAAGAIVYYDGLVLTQGARPLQVPPQFATVEGQSGEWGGLPFVNYLRNGSAERSSLRFQPWADDLGARFLPDHARPSLFLTFLSDWRTTMWILELSAARLLRTFWGTFGWGHIPLIGHKPYRLLAVFTLAALFGVFFGLWRVRRRLPWSLLLWLGLALSWIYASTLLRGAIYIAVPRIYLPVARYLFPAIIPTLLLLCLGWLELGHLAFAGGHYLVDRWKLARVKQSFQICTGSPIDPRSVVYSLVFIGLDILSILSITQFYDKR